MNTNPKVRYVDFKRKALIKKLEKLKSKVENPDLTQEQLDAIRAEVEECQQQFKELAFGS